MRADKISICVYAEQMIARRSGVNALNISCLYKIVFTCNETDKKNHGNVVELHINSQIQLYG